MKETNREGDVLMTERQIRDLLGGVSQMTLKRYREKHNFPAPHIRISQRPLTWRSDVSAWIEKKAEMGVDFHLPHHLKGRPSAEQPEA